MHAKAGFQVPLLHTTQPLALQEPHPVMRTDISFHNNTIRITPRDVEVADGITVTTNQAPLRFARSLTHSAHFGGLERPNALQDHADSVHALLQDVQERVVAGFEQFIVLPYAHQELHTHSQRQRRIAKKAPPLELHPFWKTHLVWGAAEARAFYTNTLLSLHQT